MNGGSAREHIRANVSRETFDRLTRYAEQLEQWQRAINLVSKNTIPDLWSRHFLDSFQVFANANIEAGKWVDIGSGAGFPGLVCAALAMEKAPKIVFTLIESDQRKCSFLRTITHELGAPATIITSRIEHAPPQEADILSARALASLSKLNEYAERHLKPSGVALFPKGATHAKEIKDALETWDMSVESVPSQTDPNSVILKIGDIRRA